MMGYGIPFDVVSPPFANMIMTQLLWNDDGSARYTGFIM